MSTGLPGAPADEAVLFGRCEPAGGSLQPEVAAAFERLRRRAQAAGIDLAVASGYRSFDRQLSIWNRKACGELPVLDDHGQRIELAGLPEHERVMAILRWSALPGASRHHWGTDCDVYDRAAVPSGYAVQLTPEEARGTFARLHRWLDEQISTGRAEGFFRPYDQDRGGIAPEPWHLSYAPLAVKLQQQLTLQRLARVIESADMACKQAVLQQLPEIHRRFIQVPGPRYGSPASG